MIVGWDDIPPYQWKKEDGSLTGVDIDIITAVLNHAGYDIHFKKMPWARLLNTALKNGEVDIVLSASKTADREKFANFSSIPYAPWDSVMFVQKSKRELFANVHSLSDITKHDIKLGVTRGSIYSQEYEELLKNPDFTRKLYYSSKDESSLKMLTAGRLDAVLSSNIGTLHTIKDWNNKESILFHIYLNTQNDSTGSHLMFSKSSVKADDFKRIDRALIELSNNNTLKQILQRYLSPTGEAKSTLEE